MDFSDSSIRILAHRHNVMFSGIGIILKDTRAGLVALSLGKMWKVKSRDSRERFRGAHRQRRLGGPG